MYDSTEDTIAHIERVAELIREDIEKLEFEARTHDWSKLVPPEKEAFDRETPLLKKLEYGSPEYKESLARLGEALQHHYAHNLHHPESFENGINDMTWVQIDVMLNDWKAATERMKDGDIRKSITKNKERFGMSDQLTEILLNTVEARGW